MKLTPQRDYSLNEHGVRGPNVTMQTIQQGICLFLGEKNNNLNQRFSNQISAPRKPSRLVLPRMHTTAKAYTGSNHENQVFFPHHLDLGQLTLARVALDSLLYQQPANPSDSRMNHSGRWGGALQGQEGGCHEDMQFYPPTL